jgi:hypothetical protein
LRLKIRDECSVKNKAVYLTVGIDATGRKNDRHQDGGGWNNPVGHN